MTPAEYAEQIVAQWGEPTAEQVEAAARILASVETEQAAA